MHSTPYPQCKTQTGCIHAKPKGCGNILHIIPPPTPPPPNPKKNNTLVWGTTIWLSPLKPRSSPNLKKGVDVTFLPKFCMSCCSHLLSDNFHTCLYLKCILRVNDQGAQPKFFQIFFQDFIFKFWIWALMLMGFYWDVIVAWCNLWSLVKRGSRNGLRKLNLNHIFIKGFSLNLVFFLVMKPRVSGRF